METERKSAIFETASADGLDFPFFQSDILLVGMPVFRDNPAAVMFFCRMRANIRSEVVINLYLFLTAVVHNPKNRKKQLEKSVKTEYAEYKQARPKH